MIGPEQGETHIPIQTPIQIRSKSSNSVPDPSIPDQRSQYLKIDVALGACSMPVPDQTQYLVHTHPVSLVGTSKSQSWFQTLRQHSNMHARHVVLISCQSLPLGKSTSSDFEALHCQQRNFDLLGPRGLSGGPTSVNIHEEGT